MGTYISVAYQSSSTEALQTSPDAVTWTARSSAADGQGGYCIAASPTAVVAIVLDSSGFTSVALRSTDAGATWVSNTIPQHFQYAAVAYGGGVWVAMDFLGHIIRSTDDGVTWSNAATLASNDGGWQALTYGNGLFVAVGADDASGTVVATSADGSTWTSRTAPVALWQGVCYGGGLFVAVGGPNPLFSGLTGNSCVMTSPDGVTWTSRTPAGASTFSWRAVAYDGIGLYLAVAGNSAGTLMSSPDGSTWSTVSASGTGSCFGVTHGGGLWVVSQDDPISSGQTIVTSPDASTWTVQTAALLDKVTATVYLDPCASLSISCGSPPAGTVGTPYTHTFPTSGGPNLFFSISAGALPPGLSLDPATGVVSGTPTTNGPYSFTVEVQLAVIAAAGDDGSFSDSKIVLTSPDGTTWARQTTAITDSGYSIIYSADLALWIEGTDDAGTTDQVQTSPNAGDGTWTAQSSPADSTGSVRRLVAGPGQVVGLFFKSGTMNIMTSPDGVTWTQQTLPITISNISPTADLTYSPDLGLYCIADVTPLVALPFLNGGVLTSPDAITWTLRYKDDNMPCFGLAWGNGLFVSLGGIQGSGIHLQTSPDGINWTTQADPGGSAQGWADIWFADGIFVAVSDDITTNPNNQAAWSADGISWSIVATPGTGKKWSAVSFGFGTWVAGDGGFGSTQPLMTSTDSGVTWSLIPVLGFSYGFINGIAFGANACSATAGCSITIGGGTVMGNIWGGGSGQGAGNHW